MVVVDGRRLVWRDKLVFFPSVVESQTLLEALQHNDILRIRQMSFQLTECHHLIQARSFQTSCIDLTKDIKAIYGEMDSMTQRYVRKAEKLRQRWKIRGNDFRCYADFLQLYNDFVRLKAHTYPLSQQRFQEYLKVSDVWVIYFEERPIAGRLVVRDDTVKRVRMILSPTSRLLSEEDARLSGTLNRYLHWHELVTYKQQGIELYDFGGIGDGSSSVAKFKLSFGGFRVNDYSYVVAGPLGVIAYRLYRALSNSVAQVRSLGRQQTKHVAPRTEPE
jgi:hypothetical protein